MKKIVLASLSLLLYAASLNAVPAWPGRIVHTQPDGSRISLYRHGDEWRHWFTDEQGRIVSLGTDGYYHVSTGVSVAPSSAAQNMRRTAAMQERKAAADKHVAIGQKRFLVVLVEFADLSFSVEDAQAAFHNMMNQSGYSDSGGTGSARDYYYDNSHGVFEPVFDVLGPVKLPKEYAYYGENDSEGWDKHPDEALREACRMLDDQIDYSDYDLDGDGRVDLVFMYYAGYGEAEVSDTNTIWPHQGSLGEYGSTLLLDGKRINKYACTCELIGYGKLKGSICGIGTACHEFGHAMGLPDFYDTDYDENGEAGGLYDFSLMCGGSYNNDSRTPPYFNFLERTILGWFSENDIRTFDKRGSYVIPPVNENVAYMSPTDTPGEFFMYECRTSEGWDAYAGGEGLLVYHVDKSKRTVEGSGMTALKMWNDWIYYNNINAYGVHPCFYLIPATAQTNLFFKGKMNTIPFPGKDNVTEYTPKSWSGASGDFVFSNIAYNPGSVTMDVECPEFKLGYASIANPGQGVYSAGSLFILDLLDNGDEPAARVIWTVDGKLTTTDSFLLTAGRHTVEAAVITTSARTYFVSLEIEAR